MSDEETNNLEETNPLEIQAELAVTKLKLKYQKYKKIIESNTLTNKFVNTIESHKIFDENNTTTNQNKYNLFFQTLGEFGEHLNEIKINQAQRICNNIAWLLLQPINIVFCPIAIVVTIVVTVLFWMPGFGNDNLPWDMAGGAESIVSSIWGVTIFPTKFLKECMQIKSDNPQLNSPETVQELKIKNTMRV